MRFRFVGELDCPDWVLAEISLLSRLTSIKLKLFAQLLAKSLQGTAEFDSEKAQKFAADAKFSESDLKASIAVVNFILESAAKNRCAVGDLNQELQQLGLPAEHAAALCKVYEESLSGMIENFKKNSLKLPSVSVETWKWESLPETDAKFVKIEMKCNSEPLTIAMSKEKLDTMISELKEAENIMKNLYE